MILPAPLRPVLIALAATLACAPLPGHGASAELRQRPFLYQITQHLYRWYLDESDAQKIVDHGQIAFHVRDLDVALDEGDRSRIGQIAIPVLGIEVKVKLANYDIPELGITVKNDCFKIIDVARVQHESYAGFDTVMIGYKEMIAALFQHRNETRFPEGELLTRMRAAARRAAQFDGIEQTPAVDDAAAYIVHFAPLSDVANEAWVFWEAGRKLIRFASDIDLSNPAVWQHEELAAKLYDIDEQVVVSLSEVPGSNAYMTRDQVGRALYNCVVLGRRVALPPAAAAAAAAAPTL
jgi:hypothetical protein